MHARAIALDYDGTIASRGQLDPDVRCAICEARTQGFVVVLATGRRLDDLIANVGDLRIFDAVVAENGALVHFPETGRSLLQVPTPRPAFAQALRQRGVSITCGTCVIEASANDACSILEEIRQQELPLVVLFNRERAMVLPQGVSKGAGLLAAFDMLRISAHNAIGIGDAENDHSILDVCELGAAVSWGSHALQVRADIVIQGTGPTAVAGYIWSIVQQPRIGTHPVGRQHVQVGLDGRGAPFTLALRERNVLIVGDPRSGKSWLAGLLAEQMILLGYCICILDPEGDYTTLGGLPGVVTLGGEDPAPHPRDIWRALRYPDTSVVVDLSHRTLEEKRDQIAALLPVLAALRAEMGFPHRILLDEAHYFVSEPTIRGQLHLQDGGYILATYRVDQLPPDALDMSGVVLATRVRDLTEVRTLAALRHQQFESLRSVLGDLALDEAVLLPSAAEADGTVRRVHLLPRLTLHVRHRQKYLDVPVLARHAFVFTGSAAPSGQRAATLSEFVRIVRASPVDLLAGHLRSADVSRWIRDVFGDDELAAQLATIEHSYRARISHDPREAIARSIENRYASESE